MTETRTDLNARIRRKVSLVLLLIDDFSNKEITGSNARAWIFGEKPPVRKPEGYFVFTNLNQPEVEVSIEAGLYESRTLWVKLQEDVSYTFLKVRLTPNRSYPIPRDTTCVEGKAEPGSLIRIVCLEDSKPMKLIYDYRREESGGSKISIYHPETVDIEGKALYIENSKSGAEFFRVLQKGEENGAYEVEQPLSRDYRKIGTAIFSVFDCTADERGYFFLPLPYAGREGNRFLCEAQGKEILRKECQFKAGVINRLDLVTEGE